MSTTTSVGTWVDGWWSGARRTPAHPARVGPTIRPWGIVVHSTDMTPESWEALITAYTTRPGLGECATFGIGRDPDAGIVQWVPITRNANHAGGDHHGVYRVPGAGGAPAMDINPNTVTVAIEVHCAGGLRRIDGAWRLVENNAPTGRPIPDSDVTPDPARPGRGWHRPTTYQLEQLDRMLFELDRVLPPPPPGTLKIARGEQPPAAAIMPLARIATHWELDPTDRSDPWPPITDWLRAWCARSAPVTQASPA